MEGLIQSWIQERKKANFTIYELEDYIKPQFPSANEYEKSGGYHQFYRSLRALESQTIITPVKKTIKETNSRDPALPIYWRIVHQGVVPVWSSAQIMSVSSHLSLDFYIRNPQHQNDRTWQHIHQLYQFIKSSAPKEWITREERSFEIFGLEKYLGEADGQALLHRLGLTLEDLMANINKQQFVYWQKPYTDIQNAKTILITENSSSYSSFRRYFNAFESYLGLSPDVLIFGNGKQIESSLSYIDELIPQGSGYTVYYIGDIDPDGIGIYSRLKTKYPNHRLELAVSLYEKMVQSQKIAPIEKEQTSDEAYLRLFTEELKRTGKTALSQKIEGLWTQRMRIPQETINYQTMVRERRS